MYKIELKDKLAERSNVASTFVSLFFVACASFSAVAEKMDMDTHTLLIEKLESALKSLPAQAKERASITQRLADLYSDRARLKFIQKQEQNCQDCSDGSDDRGRAAELYQKVIPKVNGDESGSLLLQLAHLQSSQGKIREAKSTLEKAIRSKKSNAETLSRAHSGMGELLFNEKRFVEAEKHFSAALKAKSNVANAGLVTYHLAWCQLNQGQFQKANRTVLGLLHNQELFTVEKDGRVEFDQSFHDDVARDLVNFMAREEVGQKEIQKLLDLTPEHLRKENLHAFANELERLGKKASAALAWEAYYAENDESKTDSLESRIRVAQLQWDMGKKAAALNEFRGAVEYWRSKGCAGEICPDLQKRLKNFVITWNKVEKEKPSIEVLEAYKSYLSQFSDDAEMYYKAATVADQTKHHQDAVLLYAQVAKLSSQKANRNDKASQDLLDASLLKQIEAAELTKDAKARIASYDQYLDMNPNGPKALEVRYQKAHTLYEGGHHDEAFGLFIELAHGGTKNEDKVDRDIRVKSADLALDCLALRSDDEKLFQTAANLKQRFPERSADYDKIQRQAAIKLAARQLDTNASDGQLRSELARLSNLDLKSATQADRVLILKNRLSLAARLKDLDQVQQAAETLLNERGLTAKDRGFAVERLIWVAELKMDFSRALSLVERNRNPKKSREEQELQLAMFSELAGLDATKHYRKALTLTRSNEKANSIRIKLIRRAQNPWLELTKHYRALAKNRTLLSQLVIELYSETGNEKEVRRFLSRSELRRSSLNQLFAQREFMSRYQKADSQIKRHFLSSHSQAQLTRSLNQRLSQMKAVEQLGTEALRSQNWLGQLGVLTTLARENQRLYRDLMALPVPRQLKARDRQQYSRLLSSRAEPFAEAARLADKKVQQFLSNEKAQSEIESAYRSSHGHMRSLVAVQVKALAQLTGSGRFEKILNDRSDRPSARDLNIAKARLRRDPFDRDVILETKKLADQRGETTLVAFLDARLQQLKSGVRQ